MATFTDNIGLINPLVGGCDWDGSWYRNQYIIDAITNQLAKRNFVYSGCVVTIDTGLQVAVGSGSVSVNGVEYDVTGGLVSVEASVVEGVSQWNFIYIDSTGTLISTDAEITDDQYCLLALVDCNLTSVERIKSLIQNKLANVEKVDSLLVENDCINGTFDAWQRGTSQTLSGYGSADRMKNIYAITTRTVTREEFPIGQTDVPGGPKYFHRTTISASGGTSSSYVIQQIKLQKLLEYSGKTICLKFHGKADAIKDCAVEAFVNYGTGGSPSAAEFLPPEKVELQTTWKKNLVFISIPDITGKTLGTNNNSFVGFDFWFEAGSDFDDRSDSLGLQTGVFDIAEIEIYPSDVELPVRRKTYAETLHECHYYYWQGSAIGSNRGDKYASAGADRRGAEIVFPREMRTVPSVTIVTAPIYFNCTSYAINVSKVGATHNVTVSPTGMYNVYNGVYAVEAEI